MLESLYFLMQYKFGSAARRGRAFMDLNGPWMPFLGRDELDAEDGTNAPDVHWDWNIQGMYYLPFLTNRPEIAASLIDYVEGLLHSGVLWSPSNVQRARTPDTKGSLVCFKWFLKLQNNTRVF